MSQVKVKKVKVPITVNNKDLNEMFNRMIGEGSVDVEIAYPRYQRIGNLCECIVSVFELLASSPPMLHYEELRPHKKELDNFCTKSREQISELFNVDLNDYVWSLNSIPDALRQQFEDKYKKCKNSRLVGNFIIMCNNLVLYKQHIADPDRLNPNFIANIPGGLWQPFPFTTLNMKRVIALPKMNDNTLSLFMIVLSKAYELSYKLYEEIQSPDIDVDQMAELLINNFDALQKKLPELSRCQRAVKKIKDSIGLLKERFNGYYRDFIATKDNTIIMQHFLLDVSKTVEMDAELSREFRIVIEACRKHADSSITNPQFRKLLEQIESSYNLDGVETDNIEKARNKTPAADVSRDDTAPGATKLLAAGAKTYSDVLGGMSATVPAK